MRHGIPIFDGADKAAARLQQLPEFDQANLVKVNPDTPQKSVRLNVLKAGKTLLTPQPRLRTGFFSIIAKDTIPEGVRIQECTTSRGLAKYGTPVGLNEAYTVDIVALPRGTCRGCLIVDGSDC